MLQEQDRQTVERVLRAVFGDKAPPVELKAGQLAIACWTIWKTEEAPEGLGPARPVYCLDEAVPVGGTRDEPPGVDVCELAYEPHWFTLVGQLVAEVARRAAEAELEADGLDALAQEKEQGA